MTIFHIMYISTAVVVVEEAELREMLAQYRRNNERDNITGLLLYSGENYVQLIEGQQADLQRLFAKIEKDYHHTSIIQLANGPINERIFGNWSMGFKTVDPAEMKQLKGYVNAEDARFLRSLPLGHDKAAVKVLRHFAKNRVIDIY